MLPLSSKDTARMASEEVEVEKNSLKLTGAALNELNIAKNDNEDAETAEVIKEGRNELPIREGTKESEITLETKKQRMVLTLPKYRKKQWPCH